MVADIIVNSSSPSMIPQMGVSKSIHNKCGPGLLKYLKANYNGILSGGIVDSPNFGLKCKKIIHVCGPYQKNESHRELETIYEQCLNYCFSHRYNSIIFPCISTGGSMFNEDRGCMIAINTCKNWIEKNGDLWKGKVIFCCSFHSRLFLNANKQYLVKAACFCPLLCGISQTQFVFSKYCEIFAQCTLFLCDTVQYPPKAACFCAILHRILQSHSVLARYGAVLSFFGRRKGQESFYTSCMTDFSVIILKI